MTDGRDFSTWHLLLYRNYKLSVHLRLLCNTCNSHARATRGHSTPTQPHTLSPGITRVCTHQPPEPLSHPGYNSDDRRRSRKRIMDGCEAKEDMALSPNLIFGTLERGEVAGWTLREGGQRRGLREICHSCDDFRELQHWLAGRERMVSRDWQVSGAVKWEPKAPWSAKQRLIWPPRKNVSSSGPRSLEGTREKTRHKTKIEIERDTYIM